MKKTVISTENAPKAIGPYSQAVTFGDMIFVSGQIPVDPKTGELVSGDIKVKTARCFGNIKAILESAGAALNDIVKVTVFLKNMEDFAAMNETYKEFFTEGSYPARSAVEVAKLPKNVDIEIEVIAAKQ